MTGELHDELLADHAGGAKNADLYSVSRNHDKTSWMMAGPTAPALCPNVRQA
jgi:hypothetical protein